MAVPALLERITGEDLDNDRQLSSHHIEAAFAAMRGGFLGVPAFKAQISSTVDDDTDIDNLVALVIGDDAAKTRITMGIIGIVSLAHHGYFNAATARTKLGIAAP